MFFKSKQIKSDYLNTLRGMNLILKTIQEINNSKTEGNILKNFKKNQADIEEIVKKTIALNNEKIEELEQI